MHKTTIVCAVDFSRASLLGLRVAIGVALRTHAHLRVVQVLRPGGCDTRPYQPRTSKRVEAEVSEAIGRLDGSTHWVSSSVETGDFADEVAQIADRFDADLIFIGTRAKTGWERVRDGYLPEEIASTAGCPVVVLEVDEERLPAAGHTVLHPAQRN